MYQTYTRFTHHHSPPSSPYIHTHPHTHLTSLLLTTLCIHIKLHSIHNQHPPPPHTHPSSPFYTQTHMHILEKQKAHIAQDVLSKILNVMRKILKSVIRQVNKIRNCALSEPFDPARQKGNGV